MFFSKLKSYCLLANISCKFIPSCSIRHVHAGKELGDGIGLACFWAPTQMCMCDPLVYPPAHNQNNENLVLTSKSFHVPLGRRPSSTLTSTHLGSITTIQLVLFRIANQRNSPVCPFAYLASVTQAGVLRFIHVVYINTKWEHCVLECKEVL